MLAVLVKTNADLVEVSHRSSIDLSTFHNALEQQSVLISSMAGQYQAQQAPSRDHIVPLLEGQQAISDRFDSVMDKNEMLANELENISSAISKQAEDGDQQDIHHCDRQVDEAVSAELEELQKQVKELRLEREVKDKAARQVAEQLARAEELASVRLQELGEKDQLQSKLDTARVELADQKRRNEEAMAVASTQASELADLSRLTSDIRDTLSTRLGSLEDILTSQGPSQETVELRESNSRLETELETMRVKVSVPAFSNVRMHVDSD